MRHERRRADRGGRRRCLREHARRPAPAAPAAPDDHPPADAARASRLHPALHHLRWLRDLPLLRHSGVLEHGRLRGALPRRGPVRDRSAHSLPGRPGVPHDQHFPAHVQLRGAVPMTVTSPARRPSVVLCAAMLAALGLHAAGAGAATPGQRCAVAKLKAAATKTASKLRCYRRALNAGAAVDQECLAAAETRFLARLGRIEGAGGCATLNDAAAVEAAVDACADTLVSILPASPTTTSTTSTTTTTAPVCPTVPTTTSTTTAPGSTTTTTGGPSATCSAIGSPCGQCGNGLCVAPIPGIPLGACVVPSPIGPCSPTPPSCGSDEVCVDEGGGTLNCYAICF